MNEGLPEDCVAEIRDFLSSARSGRILLNVEHGKIQTWELTTHGRVRQKHLREKPKSRSVEHVK